jgi:hypothetical protein
VLVGVAVAEVTDPEVVVEAGLVEVTGAGGGVVDVVEVDVDVVVGGDVDVVEVLVVVAVLVVPVAVVGVVEQELVSVTTLRSIAPVGRANWLISAESSPAWLVSPAGTSTPG